MLKQIVVVLGILAVGAGCSSQRIGDFTAISTKNIYAKNVDVSKLPRKIAEGEDMRFLGIGANFKDAVDRALEAGGGNCMIDAAFYAESGFFTSGFRVRGSVINIPYSADNPGLSPSSSAALQPAAVAAAKK